MTCKNEGEYCLFPDQGYVALGGWEEKPLRCLRLPGGGDQLYCARPIAGKQPTRRKSSGGGSDSAGSAGVFQSTKDFGNDTGAATVMVLRCPVGACGPNNTCLGNRTGPVCDYCLPGTMRLLACISSSGSGSEWCVAGRLHDGDGRLQQPEVPL
jgi:hypothetical protein